MCVAWPARLGRAQVFPFRYEYSCFCDSVEITRLLVPLFDDHWLFSSYFSAAAEKGSTAPDSSAANVGLAKLH